MYNLAIRKWTSPPFLAPRLKIFKWKCTTSPGIEPRTRWIRGRHATIWASAASLDDNYREKNLCLSWDLNLRSPVLHTGVLTIRSLYTYTSSETNFSLLPISIQDSHECNTILQFYFESNITSGIFFFFWFYFIYVCLFVSMPTHCTITRFGFPVPAHSLLFSKSTRGPPGLTSASDVRIAINSTICLLNIHTAEGFGI